MCFSAEADIALGLAVGVVGIDALRHVQHRRELPLAALPMLFAAHQFIEAFVWWGLDGQLSEAAANTAAYLYLGIAFVLPFVVPMTVRAIETDETRRRVMLGLALLGAVVSAVLLTALVRNGPSPAAEDLHVSYSVRVSNGLLLTLLYVLATCGAFLAASPRRLVVVGALNLVAVALLGWLNTTGVISLWCAWAAVVSVLLALHLRTENHAESPHFAPVRGGGDARAHP